MFARKFSSGKFLMSLVAFVAAGFAQPVQAARVLVEYSTIIDGSEDRTGAFGGSGSSLDGQKALVSYTLTVPTLNAGVVYTPLYHTIYGGSGHPLFTGLPMTATITINGITRSMGFKPGSEASATHSKGYDPDSEGSVDFTHHSVSENGSDGIRSYFGNIDVGIDVFNNFLLVSDLTAPVNYALQSNDEGAGGFAFSIFNKVTVVEEAFVYGQLRPYEYRISTLPDLPMSAVPEPGSWALMFAGFGLIGFTMRARGGFSKISRSGSHGIAGRSCACAR